MTLRSPAAVFDILHCIISHLDPDVYVDPDPYWDPSLSVRQILVRLAVTHSTFTRPALSMLWKSLPDDRALKHVLRVVGIAKLHPGTYSGLGEPEWDLCEGAETLEMGWKKFQEYACLVRRIVVDPFARREFESWDFELEPATSCEDTFWYRVSNILGGTPVLPRLEVITFFSLDNLRRPVDMGALRLLSPSVCDLTMRFDRMRMEDESQLRTSFSSALSSAPNLETLCIVVVRCSPVDLDSLPQSHPRLRHLKIDAEVHPHNLTSLASLPDLEHLSIRLSRSVNTPVRFESLRSLAIVSGYELGDSDPHTVITRLDAPQLRSFSIESSHETSGNPRINSAQFLVPLTSGRFSFLEAFRWRCRQLGGDTDPDATLAELIEPLLSLRTLREIVLDFPGHIVPYSSADFWRMAEAWPDLEIFSLDGYVFGRDDRLIQYAGFESFVSFARHCPCLRSLRIPRVKIDIDGLIDTPAIPSTTPHRLRELSVDTILCAEGRSRWDTSHSEEVFRDVIRHIFPFAAIHLLTSLRSWNPPEDVE